MSDVQNTESLKILLCQTMRIILNIIIITITLLLINYNIIVTAITNFGNTMQNMLTMHRNSAKVIVVFLKGNYL